jgi:hypothetical protein
MAKKIFHTWSFQLYLRKGIFAGKHMAHKWRRELEIPKVLLPASKSRGTHNPMIGPATYQGQG